MKFVCEIRTQSRIHFENVWRVINSTTLHFPISKNRGHALFKSGNKKEKRKKYTSCILEPCIGALHTTSGRIALFDTVTLFLCHSIHHSFDYQVLQNEHVPASISFFLYASRT